MAEDVWPDPHAARDIPEFVSAMCQLRVAGKLTCRLLAERAAQAGESLSISILLSPLNPESLPRPETVRALVIACGGSEETAQSWLAARARLARATAARPAEDSRRAEDSGPAGNTSPPEHDKPAAEARQQEARKPSKLRHGPWRRAALGSASVATLALVAAGGWWGVSAQSSPAILTSAAPPIELQSTATGLYRITLAHPENGISCATVDLGGGTRRLLISDSPCEPGRADQTFRLEAVGRGYRLRSVSGPGYCVGVLHAGEEPGAQLVQDECVQGDHQMFVLEHR
jgi:hypothetical protein